MKTVTRIIICLTIAHTQSTHTMWHSTPKLPLIKLPDSPALKYVPKQLALLNPDEPITDDLLRAHNLNWRRIEIVTEIAKKNSILADAMQDDDDELSYEVRRCIIALAVCAGANPNHTCLGDYTSLHRVLSEGDYHLAHYLLKKGADPNLPSKEQYARKVPLAACKTTQLAQLLLDHGADLPENILAICCRGEYPPELLSFYLGKRASIRPDHLLNSPLHTLSSCRQKCATKTEKARILLHAGIDPAHKNIRGCTVMHLLASHHAKSAETVELCHEIIHHYTRQHAGFLMFLGFLKQNFWVLYRQKGLLKQFFSASATHMKRLKALLEIKNYVNQTAYDIWSIEELNPKTCSYENARKLI